MLMNLVFFNGELLEKNDIVISSFYRAINYGDGFFESIKIINSSIFSNSFGFCETPARFRENIDKKEPISVKIVQKPGK